MRKCTSCNRAYSDTVSQCPICGMNLTEHSPDGSPRVVSGSQKTRGEEPRIPKPVDTIVCSQNEKAQRAVGRWKIAFASLLVLTLFLAFLYVSKANDYDDLQSDYWKRNREYTSLENEYEDLEGKAALYGWGWRYIPLVMDCYNSTNEYKRISDELNREDLKGICIDLKIRDYAEKWEDTLYLDAITPSGTVIDPKSENDNHTWKIDLSNSTGNESNWYVWFSDKAWESGTYRIIFYQGSNAIGSFSLKVT